MSGKAVRIGVFGTYGFGNMGDAAVADATIANLRRLIPGAQISCICQQPDNAQAWHNVEAHSIFQTFVRHSTPAAPAATPPHVEANAPTPSPTRSLKSRVVTLAKSIKPLFWVAKWLQAQLVALAGIGRELGYSRQIFRVVRQLDLLAMSGSGQLNEEWGGPWRYPFALFRWCLLARLAGCKVAFLSVGAGSIGTFTGRLFCASALRLAHYKSVRDDRTFELTQRWGVRNVQRVPDMAFSLQFDPLPRAADHPGKPVVGINPIAFCDPRSWHEAGQDQQRYERYTEKLAAFCDGLVADGFAVQFIPNELRMDNLVIDDILQRMNPHRRQSDSILRPPCNDYHDVGSALAGCDYVIACRFHGLLFSFLARRPVITLAFHFKFKKLAEEMGQAEYALDIESFTLDQLKQAFQQLQENREQVVASINQHIAHYPEQVEQQYRHMGELVQH